MKELLLQFWQENKGKIMGLSCGLSFGILILALGFWRGLFLSLCVAIGYYIGSLHDKEENFIASLVKIIPDSIRNKLH